MATAGPASRLGGRGGHCICAPHAALWAGRGARLRQRQGPSRAPAPASLLALSLRLRCSTSGACRGRRQPCGSSCRTSRGCNSLPPQRQHPPQQQHPPRQPSRTHRHPLNPCCPGTRSRTGCRSCTAGSTAGKLPRRHARQQLLLLLLLPMAWQSSTGSQRGWSARAAAAPGSCPPRGESAGPACRRPAALAGNLTPAWSGKRCASWRLLSWWVGPGCRPAVATSQPASQPG